MDKKKLTTLIISLILVVVVAASGITIGLLSHNNIKTVSSNDDNSSNSSIKSENSTSSNSDNSEGSQTQTEENKTNNSNGNGIKSPAYFGGNVNANGKTEEEHKAIVESVDLDLNSSKRMSNLAEADVKVEGTTTVTSLSSKLWSDKKSYNCRTMSGKDSSLGFVISDLTGNKDVTLEVEEIHERKDDPIAYSVYVNGKEVYFRTYSPCSDGPNHYFIQVSGDLIGKNGRANIILKNASDSIVRFSRVWGFSSMDKLLNNQDVSRKMSVALLSPKITYNLNSDKSTINRIAHQFGNSDMYDISFGLEVPYISQSIKALHNCLDYIISLSAETNKTFNIGLNSWWSGTPSGPDGTGGYFNDINYQQIVYDPLNSDGRGNWKLCTPNIWSNVPWLTMNNLTYNTARNYRLKEATSYIQKKIAQYGSKDGNQPSISVYMENEPVYWAYYAFNNSPQAAGDYNSAVIQAAQADGVTLNPEDGLSDTERVWLYKNLKNYINNEGIAVATGFQYNTVIVNNNKVTLPSTQQIENAYTHMFPQEIYPTLSEEYAGWETHAISSLRMGGEWASPMSDERALDYMAALGKFSDVNAERSAISDYSLLPQAYLYGADHVTIYNYKTSDASLYKDASGKSNDKKKVVEYNKEVMSYDFAKSSTINKDDVLVDYNDINVSSLDYNYVVCPNNKFAKGGTLTFKVDNGGEAFTNGLELEIKGRILSGLAKNAKMTFYVGNTQNDMTEATSVNTLASKIDLSDYIDKSQSTVYVKVQLSATAASYCNWVSISSIKAYAKLNKASGNQIGYEYTNLELRNRNLFMGYRADTERLLVSYVERCGKDDIYEKACDLYKDQNYVSAYHYISSNISETLPATYMVTGNGKLGKYNMSLKLNNDNYLAYVELTKADKENYVFTISSYDECEVKLTFSGLKLLSNYKLNSLGNGKYELVKSDDSGSEKAWLGKVSFTISLHASSDQTDLPEEFEAMAYSEGSISSIKVQAQDYTVSDFANYTTLNISNKCKVWLGNDGDNDNAMIETKATAIKPGDYLKIKVDSKNKVIEIRAYRGTISGTVIAVTEISLKGTTTNASVTIQDDSGVSRTFEIGGNCQLAFSGRTGDLPKLTTVGNIGLRIGQNVNIDYCPWVCNNKNMRALKIS